MNTFPVSKITKKKSLKECVFINSRLKIQCHIVKNTLLQTALAVFLLFLFLFFYKDLSNK